MIIKNGNVIIGDKIIKTDRCCICYYDETYAPDGNNRLIDVKRAEIAKGTDYILFDLSDVYMYKAFIWTENIVPLCESREFIILK